MGVGIVTDGQTWGGDRERERDELVMDRQTEKEQKKKGGNKDKDISHVLGFFPPPLCEWTLIQATQTLLCHGVCGPVSVWAC